MATTIQVVENLQIGKYIEIGGKRCEVEAVSFSQAITEKFTLEELMIAMSEELIEREIIRKDQAGSFYWIESGEPLVPDEPFEDDACSCCAGCGQELLKEYGRGNEVFCDETCANDFNS